MNTEKTIKELADELGVTKDKVKYQARKLPSGLTSKKDGITYLSIDAICIIKKNISGGKKRVLPSDIPNQLPTDYLLGQLELKDKELNEQNKQINRLLNSNDQLQKLLDQQQVLTLQANQKIKELEYQNEATLESQKKKSFISRLFRK